MIIKDTRNWQVSLANPSTVAEGVEDIAQCVYIIISTVKGSDPLRLDFGSDVHLYLDRPVNEIQPMLVYAVTEALQKWEKRIEVKKCRVEINGLDKRTIVIEATVIASAAQITIKTNI
jgi:phage baseplate assembly protein W